MGDYKPSRFTKGVSYLKRYWMLYAMILLPMVFFLVFRYLPMTNVVLAFKEYRIMPKEAAQALEGNPFAWLSRLFYVFQMPWASDIANNPDAVNIWKWFGKAFANRDFLYALRNTLMLNMLDLLLGFPAPIILALLLNELAFNKFKRVTQTIAYMPHFLSWVIIASLSLQLFAPTSGLVNMAITSAGGAPIDFLGKPSNWVWTYILLGIWQSAGWNTIIYLAAITSINPELYEAASVDGANRLRRIWHITLPGLKPTIIVLLIMNLGRILGSDFDRPFALSNKVVTSVSNVISIFVYQYGLKSLQLPLATAVGLFQSVVCVIFLLIANSLAEKFGERGIW